MNIKEPVLIARTARRERCDVDHGEFWCEFRLRSAGYCGSGYCVDTRYTRTDGDQTTVEDWQLWQVGTTPQAAVEEGFGDTRYTEAESLHPLHAKCKEHHLAVRVANDEAYKLKQSLESAVAEMESYKYECNRDFQKKCQGKDDAWTEKCKARMLKTRGPHMEELLTRIQELSKATKDAELKAKELTVKAGKQTCMLL